MTIHNINTKLNGQNICVSMGWDRPLKYFFMNILDENDETLFSNLFSKYPHPRNLDIYLGILKFLDIKIPAKAICEIYDDAENDRGNRYETWEVSKNTELADFNDYAEIDPNEIGEFIPD